MRPDRLVFSLRGAALALLFAACACAARAQAQGAAAPARGGCETKVSSGIKPGATPAPDDRVGVQVVVSLGKDAPVARKRFFLLARSAASAGIDWSALPAREEFYTGASPELRRWLAEHDCDTLYCPEYEAEFAKPGFAETVKAVPEFRRAYQAGLDKYRNEKLALRWVTVNFPLKNVRSAYFRRKRAWLEEAARRAGAVASVMTDEKGAAVFTNLKPGSYYVSNLAPLDKGGLLWDCPVTTAPPLPRSVFSVTVNLGPPKQPPPAPAR